MLGSIIGLAATPAQTRDCGGGGVCDLILDVTRDVQEERQPAQTTAGGFWAVHLWVQTFRMALILAITMVRGVCGVCVGRGGARGFIMCLRQTYTHTHTHTHTKTQGFECGGCAPEWL